MRRLLVNHGLYPGLRLHRARIAGSFRTSLKPLTRRLKTYHGSALTIMEDLSDHLIGAKA